MARWHMYKQHTCFNDIELKTHEKQKTDYEHKHAKNQFPKMKGRKHRSKQT